MQLNNVHIIFIPKLPIHFHASSGISYAPTAFPHFIPLSVLSVSSSLMFRVITCWGLFLLFQLSGFHIHQHVKVLAPTLLALINARFLKGHCFSHNQLRLWIMGDDKWPREACRCFRTVVLSRIEDCLRCHRRRGKGKNGCWGKIESVLMLIKSMSET